MVNPGAFKGARKEFLMGERPAYYSAVEGSCAADGIADIWRRYFKRFPIDMDEDVEPTVEEIQAVDDEAAEPDAVEPDEEKLSPQDYKAAVEKWQDRKRRLTFKKAQIRRWMAYQYRKKHDMDPVQSGAYDPYRALLAKLIGNKQLGRPRAKSATNMWRKTRRVDIEARAKEIREADKKAGKKEEALITVLDRVARDKFSTLPKEEQKFWKSEAKTENDAALERWIADMNGPVSTEPAARQRCIQALVQFAQPILDLMSEATGWPVSMITGGPEPAQGGQLSILSMHSGTTSGDIKMNFGRAERAKFRSAMVPCYGGFLRKCFTAEECHARALDREEGYIPMAELEESDSLASWDTVPLTAPSNTNPTIQGTPSSNTQTNSSNIPTKSANVKKTPAPRPALVPVDPNTSSPATSSTPDVPATFGGLGPIPANEDSDEDENPYPVILETTPAPSPAPSRAPSPAPSSAPSPAPSRAPSPAPACPALPPASIPSSPPSSCEPSRPTATSLVEPATNDTAIGTEATPLPTVQADQTSLGASNEGGKGSVKNPGHRGHPTPSPMEVDDTSATSSSAKAPSAAMDVDNVSLVPDSSIQPGRRSTRTVKQSAKTSVEKPGEKGRRGKKRGQAETEVETSEANAERGQKKIRLSTESSDVPHPAAIPGAGATGSADIPSDAPAWFVKALGMISSLDLGPEWVGVLGKWATFEALEGYKGSSNLSATERPTAVKDWIQRARSPTWRPSIVDTNKYGSQFQGWWVSLQPDWRVSGDGRVLSNAVEGNWDVVRKGGINGLLSVIAALFFWGSVAKEKGGRDAVWISAVEDVDAVLTRLISTK